MQILDKPLSTRYGKVSGIVIISRLAGHAAQLHVPLECLKIYQLINTPRSLNPEKQTRYNNLAFERYVPEEAFPLFKRKKRLSKEVESVSVLSKRSCLVSLQNKITESPASTSDSHHIATERVEELTPFCAAASSNRVLPTPS